MITLHTIQNEMNLCNAQDAQLLQINLILDECICNHMHT